MRAVFWPYAMAVLATACAATLRLLLDPVLGPRQPFVLFFFAHLVVAWLQGWKPAVVAMILGYLFASFFFIPPGGSFLIQTLEYQLNAYAYFLLGAMCIWLADSRRRALQRLEQHALRLEESVHQRTRELQQTHERFRLASQHGGIATWTMDKLTGQTTIDEAAAEWLGVAPAALPRIFTAWEQHCHPEDLPHTRAAIAACEAGQVPEATFAWRFRRGDGSYHWVQTRGQVVRDAHGTVIQAFGTLVDVHNLKEAELSLRQTAAIVASSDNAIYSVDARGVILTWNPGAETLFGYTAQEVVGKSILLIVPPDRNDEGMGILDRVLHGRSVRQLETMRLRKDGKTVAVSLSAAPILDDHGMVKSVAVVVADITQRRRLEEQIRQAHKMEAIGRLAGGVAHDFNNLLTVINGCSEMLLGTGALANGSAELLHDIKKAGERAATLTKQLLTFSRQQTFMPVVLSLNGVVQDMDKLLRRMIGEDIDMVSVLEPSLQTVKADRGQLEQVLMNLVVNARDAMPRGGYLTITTQNVNIPRLAGTSNVDLLPGPYAMLTVTDTGHGMDETTRVRIFDPFFTTKDVGKGTGLGLAMVHGIVKQSGGVVNVYSEVNKGTTFKIYLPAVVEHVVEVPTDSQELRLARGSETVLLVEDEANVRKLTQMQLEAQGYRVLPAGDGRAALQLLEGYRGPLDLIVTDVVMPHMDGPQLVEVLRKRYIQLRVLFVSGYAGDALIHHGLLNGEPSFLQKPFSAVALAKHVRAALDMEPLTSGAASARR